MSISPIQSRAFLRKHFAANQPPIAPFGDKTLPPISPLPARKQIGKKFKSPGEKDEAPGLIVLDNIAVRYSVTHAKREAEANYAVRGW
jgi:hypothetical protein